MQNIYNNPTKVARINGFQMNILYLNIVVVLLSQYLILLGYPLNRIWCCCKEMDWINIINWNCNNSWGFITKTLKIFNTNSATNMILCQLWLLILVKEILCNYTSIDVFNFTHQWFSIMYYQYQLDKIKDIFHK